MNTVTIVLLVILAVLIIGIVVLYFLGKKAQKRQEEQQAQIEANKQTVSMLIIDKKRLPLKESGLPQMVIDQTPKMMRRSKLPIVKAKVGPQMMSLVCDEKIFDKIGYFSESEINEDNEFGYRLNINNISIKVFIFKDIGEITEVKPNINNILNILEHITFPIAISVSPLRVAIILVTSSGKLVPMAIIVNAITVSLIPSVLAIPVAPLTTNCPPKAIPAIPIIIYIKSFNLNFVFSS